MAGKDTGGAECVCVYVHVCVHIQVHYMHMYIYMYMYMYVHVHIYMHVFTYVYLYTYLYIQTPAKTLEELSVNLDDADALHRAVTLWREQVCACVREHVYFYVCVYVCVCGGV